jgi:myo-inositol-1-phosphate synthase
MGKVKVAIIGVGNCSSALIQGVHYYQDANKDEFVPGLLHADFGGYHVRDIKFVAAFDIDSRKVGNDLSKAIYSKPNNTRTFYKVPNLNVDVYKGPPLDGVGKYVKDVIKIDPNQKPVDVARILSDSGALK